MANSNGFAVEIMAALEEYNSHVGDVMKEVLPDVAKEAADMVKGASPGKGRYASGWRSKLKQGALDSVEAVVYNAKMPGLPHLLEKDHALRNGRRSNAYVHIKPVEEWVKTEAAQRLEDALR